MLGSEGSAVTFQDGWVLKLFISSVVPITADLQLFQFDQYDADEGFSFSIDFVRGRAEAWSFDATTGILSLTGAVPEPTSLALFALGALALVKRRR